MMVSVNFYFSIPITILLLAVYVPDKHQLTVDPVARPGVLEWGVDSGGF